MRLPRIRSRRTTLEVVYRTFIHHYDGLKKVRRESRDYPITHSNLKDADGNQTMQVHFKTEDGTEATLTTRDELLSSVVEAAKVLFPSWRYMEINIVGLHTCVRQVELDNISHNIPDDRAILSKYSSGLKVDVWTTDPDREQMDSDTEEDESDE